MEQTLGKRIAENRKRLGMTQDALAEKLGITAQAVSKWENDLSCPDINILPKLADIFGITTDELLGQEPPKKVYTAEVLDDDTENHDRRRGTWEFHWDSGRKQGLTFAFFVLWVGVLTLLVRWMEWDVSFWSIMWPSLLLIYSVFGIVSRFSVWRLGIALLGGYSLLANLNLWKLSIAGELIFPICVILFGLGLLLDSLRKPKKHKFRFVKNRGNSKDTKIECENSNNYFDCSVSFGEAVHLVTERRLRGGQASVSFGELVIDLSQVEAVDTNCFVQANCSFGEIRLKVPRKFKVVCADNTAFGGLNVTGHPIASPEGIIQLEANVSFGEVSVTYI